MIHEGELWVFFGHHVSCSNEPEGMIGLCCDGTAVGTAGHLKTWFQFCLDGDIDMNNQ